MTQEMFWNLSIVNSYIVAVLTIGNMIITILTALKLRKLNRKIGIDLTMHKELMNVLCEFVISIGDDKIKYSIEEENKREFPILIHNNYAHMKNTYQKVNMYIDYCYTNNENFKKALECVYNNYSLAFELLFEGISMRQISNDNNNENLKMLEEATEKLATYYSIVKNNDIKKTFFEQLKTFVKNETNYIKGN